MNEPQKPDKRRSQRSLLVMPLAVSWSTPVGMRVREHAETEVVSACGALLRLKTRISAQGLIDVKRPNTNQSVRARVVSVSNPGPDGWIRVGIEFTEPHRDFWGICFPPVDETAPEDAAPAKPTLASLMASRANGSVARAATPAVEPTPRPAAPQFPNALRPQEIEA